MSSPVVQLRSRVPRIAEAAVERARLTVVPRRRPKRAGRVPFVALVSLVLLGGVIGLLLFNTSMQQASFAATALEGQARTLAAREQALQMELDRLRDPQHLALSAKQLGMVAGCPQTAFLDLRTGKTVGEPCVASRTTDTRVLPHPPARPGARTVVVPAAGAGRDAHAGEGRSTRSGTLPTDDTTDGARVDGGAGGTDGANGTRSGRG